MKNLMLENLTNNDYVRLANEILQATQKDISLIVVALHKQGNLTGNEMTFIREFLRFILIELIDKNINIRDSDINRRHINESFEILFHYGILLGILYEGEISYTEFIKKLYDEITANLPYVAQTVINREMYWL